MNDCTTGYYVKKYKISKYEVTKFNHEMIGISFKYNPFTDIRVVETTPVFILFHETARKIAHYIIVQSLLYPIKKLKKR